MLCWSSLSNCWQTNFWLHQSQNQVTDPSLRTKSSSGRCPAHSSTQAQGFLVMISFQSHHIMWTSLTLLWKIRPLVCHSHSIPAASDCNSKSHASKLPSSTLVRSAAEKSETRKNLYSRVMSWLKKWMSPCGINTCKIQQSLKPSWICHTSTDTNRRMMQADNH